MRPEFEEELEYELGEFAANHDSDWAREREAATWLGEKSPRTDFTPRDVFVKRAVRNINEKTTGTSKAFLAWISTKPISPKI